jgi:hypothetical protein
MYRHEDRKQVRQPRTQRDEHKSGNKNGSISHTESEHFHFGGDNTAAQKYTVSLCSAGRHEDSIFQKGVRSEAQYL